MLQRAVDASVGKKRVVGVSRFHTADSCELSKTTDLRLPVDLLLTNCPNQSSCPHCLFSGWRKVRNERTTGASCKIQCETSERTIRLFPKACFVALSTGCVYPFVAPRTGGSREIEPTALREEYAESCFGREQVFRQSTSPACLIRLNYSVDLRYGYWLIIALKFWRNEPVDVTTG